jgi:enoyl-CoA hydratase/carnithine racemase
MTNKVQNPEVKSEAMSKIANEITNEIINEVTCEVICEIKGHTGFISLNRPKALNALSLPMIRSLMAQLLAWQSDVAIKQVAIRGMSKPAADGSDVPFGNFCAGGDIRFFHQAIQTGNPELEDFFTEEYTLNHLIANYGKPYIAFMDGIVFGGGMGISQGASHRVVTERSKIAMPETGIGLFPDVGGGYFLSRCPGFVGEYLALTGVQIGAGEAIQYNLADHCLRAEDLPNLWESLATTEVDTTFFANAVKNNATNSIATKAVNTLDNSKIGAKLAAINRYFSFSSVVEIVQALEESREMWEQETLRTLRQRSPLMLHVVLEQVRRGRQLNLAQNLQMERGMIRHCFYTKHLSRWGNASETVEGIRALAVDKDHKPRWKPATIEEVTSEMVRPFFDNPWPHHSHPLKHLVHV